MVRHGSERRLHKEYIHFPSLLTVEQLRGSKLRKEKMLSVLSLSLYRCLAIGGVNPGVWVETLASAGIAQFQNTPEDKQMRYKKFWEAFGLPNFFVMAHSC
jgi:hypothetical protein